MLHVVQQSHLRREHHPRDAAQRFKAFADLGTLAEYTVLRGTVMIHNRPVEFLRSAAALAPLEILHAV